MIAKIQKNMHIHLFKQEKLKKEEWPSEQHNRYHHPGGSTMFSTP